MTQEAKVTLLTIERYLTKNPGTSFCEALFNLHIIQFAAPKDNSHQAQQLRNILSDSDVQIMGRVIKSFPFRKRRPFFSPKQNSEHMPSNQEIDEQISDAEASTGDTLFPDLTFEDGVIAALKWVTGQTTDKPMDT